MKDQPTSVARPSVSPARMTLAECWKGMTEWIGGWVKRGWKNSQKKPVANRDLWERLLELTKTHQVEWHWVRGHDGHPENERCDALARAAIETGRDNY